MPTSQHACRKCGQLIIITSSHILELFDPDSQQFNAYCPNLCFDHDLIGATDMQDAMAMLDAFMSSPKGTA